MEEKLVRGVTAFLSVVALGTIVVLFYLPDFHLKAEEAARLREYKKLEQEAQESGVRIVDYDMEDEDVNSQDMLSHQLRVTLPASVSDKDVKIANDYLAQTVTIEIPDIDESYLYENPVVGKSDHIDELTFENVGSQGIMEIRLDEVYEVETLCRDSYLYLDFLTPKDVYEKVVVLDAGHGGLSPGAIKQGVYEKDIDLAILLELKKLFEEDENEKIGVYYTRTDDSNPTLEQRVQLANNAHADLFISVHNNSTKSGRFSSVHGTAVMYNEKEELLDDQFGSMKLSNICLEELTLALGSVNKGLVPGNDIYIIRYAKMPTALVEVGFMTNKQELMNLTSQPYQEKAAEGLYNGILRALEEIEE